MNNFKRPEALPSATYKFKTPLSPHAFYVTISDREGESETRLPFEIFINSKNMQDYQWIAALTRLLSVNFRTGKNLQHTIDELKAVHDPNGGYFKNGVYLPSLVAEIGSTLEAHLKRLGVLTAEPMPDYQKEFIAAKKAQFEAAHNNLPL